MYSDQTCKESSFVLFQHLSIIINRLHIQQNMISEQNSVQVHARRSSLIYYKEVVNR